MKLAESINLFKEKLLSTSSAPYIMKIILFGSSVKGKVRKDSDIDLLVISSNDEKVRDDVADVSFALQMDYGIPIEPLVEDLDEYIYPHTYFLYNILNYGKEVYTVEKEKLKKEAEMNLVSFNSIELAIKALLLRKIDDLPGSHGGVVGRFGELYVKTREFPLEIGRKINLALEQRNQARYKYQAVIKKENVQGVLELARSMLEKVEK